MMGLIGACYHGNHVETRMNIEQTTAEEDALTHDTFTFDRRAEENHTRH